MLLAGDHFEGRLAPVPTLMAVAAATSTLRIGATVFNNDLRLPVMLAKEVATLDLLSNGRMELGLGAGWLKSEYDQAGLSFDAPSVRVARMEEALHIIRGLWDVGPFTIAGRHYTVDGLDGFPKPLQQPRPPIFIGGGGRRLLEFAAREADTVGLLARALPEGGLELAADSEQRLAQKVAWVRAAAGNRFDQLELAMLFWGAVVTEDRLGAADQLAFDRDLTTEQVLASPYFLIGSVNAIVERLEELRERFGVSHISVFSDDAEAFAPVVARLAGR
jgi:probable F420-dependent oxidoreductase